MNTATTQTISIEEMLHRIFAPYGIPVLCGFPAGHGEVNLPLIIGAPVSIDVRSSGATISFGIEGQKQQVSTTDGTSVKSTLSTRMMLAGKQ